jgi:hypothetical protein
MSDPGLLSDAGAARAKALARRYLDDGSFGDEQVRRSAAIAAPLLVAGPRREPHSWLVGLTQGDRLVGLFQFLLDGTVMRYSTFQRRPGDLTHSPPARDWLDGEAASARAAARARDGETIEDVWLTFDRNPDRIVWAVSLRGSNGEMRTLYVAGDSTYEPPPAPVVG